MLLAVALLLPAVLVAALPHTPRELLPADKTDKPEAEPSCDTLRAMWRFSKRQSRAAQISNEIPTYRDPFAYSVWDTLQASRDAKSQTDRSNSGFMRSRSGSKPHMAYGRIIADQQPRWPAGRLRMYKTWPPGRMPSTARNGAIRPDKDSSFALLKGMVRQERMREVQEQRLAEEAAAARQFKDNSQHFGRVLSGPASSLDLVLASSSQQKRRDVAPEPASDQVDDEEGALDEW